LRWQRIVLSLLLLLAYSPGSNAQYYKQYTTSQSLISNTVYHSLLDRKGFMWFFTDKGVSKFDGTTFKNFTTFEGLGDNEVFFGHEDRAGRLWLYTYNGIPCFIRNDSVYNPGNHPLLKKLPIISFLESVYEECDTVMYFGYSSGELVKVSPTDCHRILPKQSSNNLHTVITNSHDTLILHHTIFDAYLKHDKVIGITEHDHQIHFHDFKHLLAADNNGLKIYDGPRLIWKFANKQTAAKAIYHIFYDEDSTVLCGTHNGLLIVNMKTGRINRMFENKHVSGISKDIHGNYWISTMGNGIFYLDKNLFAIRPLEIDNACNIHITQNGQCFFTIANKVYYFSGGTLASFLVPLKKDQPFKPFCLWRDHFFYSNGWNACYYNTRSRKTFNFISGHRAVYHLSENNFFMTGWNNAVVTINKKGIHYEELPGHPEKSCFDLKERVLYFSAEQKLFRYEYASRSMSLIDSIDQNQKIDRIALYNEHVVLLTNQKNIIFYGRSNGYKKRVVPTPDFICFGFYPLRGKYILNTSKGYYICDDLLTLSCRLVETPVHQPDLLLLYPVEAGMLCNLNGKYYLFSDSLLNKETITPRLIINNMVVNGRSYAGNSVIIKNERHTHVSLKMTSLDFYSTGRGYRYRVMHNKDTGQWYHTSSSDLDIHFEKYGDYTVQLSSVTVNNKLSRPQYLHFMITPPFYNTYWFYSILMLLAVAMLILGIRRYNIYRAAHFQEELSFLQLEHRAVSALLNPHFVFNAINNIQNLVNVDSKDKANNYLAVLSKLIRQNIDNLQFNFISLHEELNLVRNYVNLQNLRFEDKIRLRITAPDKTDDIQIPPLLLHTFVENSIVHGFKKDSTDFLVEITIEHTEHNYLLIKISDNGTGYRNTNKNKHDRPEPSAAIAGTMGKKTSIGIGFTRKRLQRLSDLYKVRWSIDINSLSPQGTEVTMLVYARFQDIKTYN
jgi:hypothetical protein